MHKVLPDNEGFIGGDVLLANRTLISAWRGFIELAPSRWGSARRKTWRDRSCATRTTHCIAASLLPCGNDTCVVVELAGAVEERVAVDVRFFDESGQQIEASAMTALFTQGSARRDTLALPAHLSARHPKQVAIRVRAPEKSEKCSARATCWWR